MEHSKLSGKNTQGKLRMQLAEQLQLVRRYFFEVDLPAGSFSRVSEYFRDMGSAVTGQLWEMVEKKAKEAQMESARLKKVTQLGDREREARIKQTSNSWPVG